MHDNLCRIYPGWKLFGIQTNRVRARCITFVWKSQYGFSTGICYLYGCFRFRVEVKTKFDLVDGRVWRKLQLLYLGKRFVGAHRLCQGRLPHAQTVGGRSQHPVSR